MGTETEQCQWDECRVEESVWDLGYSYSSSRLDRHRRGFRRSCHGTTLIREFTTTCFLV